ncbi:MAG: hypothetical protein RR253_03975 [Oscillospiraceae bacterium]
MEEISRFLKTKSTAMALFLSAFVDIGLGILILADKSFFVKSVSVIFILYFAVHFIGALFGVLFSFSKGLKKILSKLIYAFLSFVMLNFVYFNIGKGWGLVPLIMSIWAMVTGMSDMISFLQYRKEKSTAPMRYLIAAILNFGFGVSFIKNLYDAIPVSLTVMAVYMLLMGVTTLLDGVSAALPGNVKTKLKSRVRLSLPPYITALIPASVLGSLNEYFQQAGGLDMDLSSIQGDMTPNVEVFVHVSPKGTGAFGHVDLAIKDKVVSFGGYDMDSMKLGGGIGIGVIFEHFKKGEYIKFCQKESDKTLFGFGLVMTEEEIALMEAKLEEVKSRGYIWKCKAQIAVEGGGSGEEFEDYASRLYLSTGAVYHKFHSGQFKYYWLMGTNCVKMADTILSSCGLDTIVAGVITPGTYYTYLNKEFKRQGSRVVKREVYYLSSKEAEER